MVKFNLQISCKLRDRELNPERQSYEACQSPPLPAEPPIGLEPITCCLRNSCAANCARTAYSP